jgi:hypothetical protein
MDFEQVLEGIDFEGESFAPAAIVFDVRDGELAVVVAQSGDTLQVRWFSNPLDIHQGKTMDFAPVEGRQLACVGFVVDSLENDEAHTAKVVAQVTKLINDLPADLLELIRSSNR